MTDDLMALLAAVVLCVIVSWLRYVYNEEIRPMTTTEWCERMRKLDLGTK